MNRFAALLDRLGYEPRRNAKLRLLVDYFRHTPDPDRGYALAAMTGALMFKEAKAGLIRGLVEERTDPGLIKERLRVDLQRFFRKRSGLRPLVLPVVMEI